MLRGLAVIVALVAVPAALAGSVRTVVAAAPVSALDFDGSYVAFAEGRSARDCDRVRVWNLRTRGVLRLGRSTSCERTSTGTGIAAVSVASARVLWLHFTGGNIREWSVFTATSASPTPRWLAFVARNVDGPQPAFVGSGDASSGGLLPYAVDRRVIVLRANGSRRFAWTAPGRVTAIAAGAGRILVANAGGVVTELSASGQVLRSSTFPADVDAVAAAGSALVVQYGRTVERRLGDRNRDWTVPRAWRLADAQGDWAYFTSAGTIRRLRLSSDALGDDLAGGTSVAVAGSRFAAAAGRTVSVRPLPRG